MRGIAAARHVKALLVDLDDTLYMSSAAHASVKNAIERALWELVGCGRTARPARVSAPQAAPMHAAGFMIEHLGYENKDVVAATSVLWAQHGTTLAGLVAAGHRIHYDAWHAAVHHRAIDYDRLIAPDPQLRQVLQSVPLPKFILTNADRAHTQRCLQRLGVADCFQVQRRACWTAYPPLARCGSGLLGALHVSALVAAHTRAASPRLRRAPLTLSGRKRQPKRRACCRPSTPSCASPTTRCAAALTVSVVLHQDHMCQESLRPP